MGFLSNLWHDVRGIYGTIGKVAGSALMTALPGVGTVLGGAAYTLGTLASNGAQKEEARETAQKQLAQEQAFNAEQAELNRQFQRDERLATQEYNLDMWNKTNEYNSPAQQLKRAQEAGISPNAVFSNGVDGGGSVSPVTSTPMPGSTAAASPSIANSLLTHDAALQQMFAQARLTQAQADNAEYELSWNKHTEKVRYETLEAQRDKIFSDIGMNDFTKEQQTAMLRLTASKTQEEINVMRQQLNVLRNQSLNLLKDLQVKDSVINLNNQNAELADAKTYESLANTAQTYATTTNIELDNQIKELEVAVSNIMSAPIGTPEHVVAFKMFVEGKYEDYFNYVATHSDFNSNTAQEIRGLAKMFQGSILGLLGNTAVPAINFPNSR